MEFAERLRAYMAEEHLTQEALAKRVGIRQVQVSGWLLGKAKPGYDSLLLLSQKLHISADYWLGLVDEY